MKYFLGFLVSVTVTIEMKTVIKTLNIIDNTSAMAWYNNDLPENVSLSQNFNIGCLASVLTILVFFLFVFVQNI